MSFQLLNFASWKFCGILCALEAYIKLRKGSYLGIIAEVVLTFGLKSENFLRRFRVTLQARAREALLSSVNLLGTVYDPSNQTRSKSEDEASRNLRKSSKKLWFEESTRKSEQRREKLTTFPSNWNHQCLKRLNDGIEATCHKSLLALAKASN